MTDELENADGVSRRSMLKKSALVGGTMVWAAPVVQSITSPAFGQTDGTPPPNGDGQAISFVALLLACGLNEFRIKFDVNNDNSITTTCGPSFSVSNCNSDLKEGDPSIAAGCPTGVSAVLNPTDGSLIVTLADCSLVDYVVKCGAKAFESDPTDHTGCQDFPEDVNAPPAGQTITATFHRCSSNPPPAP